MDYDSILLRCGAFRLNDCLAWNKNRVEWMIPTKMTWQHLKAAKEPTEVLSWPNTGQPVFIKVSAPGLSVNNKDWMRLFFIDSLSSPLFGLFFF